MRVVVPDQVWARKGAQITAAAITITAVALLALGYPALASGPAHPAEAHEALAATPHASSAVPEPATDLHAAALPGSVQEWVPAKPVHVAKPAPHDTAVISALSANGIPATALNAYRVAAARLGHVEPGCGIDWALLAGIGREESDHGRFAGAVLHTDGTSTPKIIGPALNGHGNQYIPAPANGVALDGDANYTHALGPMQFIPQTWAGYGADANGDGVADVFNINDAALGAARYLCAAGGDLRTRAGQERGVLAYNHSDAYLAQVLALADGYRRGIPISGLPVGNTTGALSDVPKTGTSLPASPGQPIGAHDGTAKGTKTGAKSGAKTGGKSGATSSSAASGGGSAASQAAAQPTATSGTSTKTASPTTASTASAVPAPKPSLSSSRSKRSGGTASSSPTPSGSSSATCRLNLLGHCVG